MVEQFRRTEADPTGNNDVNTVEVKHLGMVFGLVLKAEKEHF